MKTILTALAVVTLFGSAVLAADTNPPLLCDASDFKAAKASSPQICPPPPPVCPPAPPACPPAPTACAAPETKVIQVPVKTTVCEVKTVPVTRRVVEEECYVENVTRTGTANEVRTRTKERIIEVPASKMVSEAKIIEMKSPYGNSTRLARGVNRKIVPTTRKEREQYEETYLQPVKYTYTEPVVKTRRVTRKVEEYKTVTVPKTITTMETRVVTR